MHDFDSKIKDFIKEAQLALDQGVLPRHVTEATGESYILFDQEEKPLGFFKIGSPDEILCECIGYRLDHAGFAGVPPTEQTRMKCESLWGNRRGSFQLFVGGGYVMGHLPFQEYETVPDEQVRKIAILDIRLLNSDRHEYNLIYENETLIPIDHSEILTTNSLVGFLWTEWPQAHTLFSEGERAYIEHLNPMEDYRLLIDEFKFSRSRAATCYLATLFLQIGMKCGFTVGEIGGLMLLRQLEGYPHQVCTFKQVLDRVKELPMHTWDHHVKKAIQGMSECV